MITPNIFQGLPGPLSVLIERFEDEQDSYRKVLRLRDCFEWIIKWHTATTLSYILNPDFVDVDRSDVIKSHLADRLRSPSLGVWMDFYRVGKKSLKHALPLWLKKETLLGVEQKWNLVKFRNNLAHGPFLEEDSSRKLLRDYEPALATLAESSCLHLLLVVGANEPDKGRILMGNRETLCDLPKGKAPFFLTESKLTDEAQCISLWPLADYCKGPTEQRKGLFYFNALKGEKIEQLSYELQTLHRTSTIWEEFMECLPYREWRCEKKSNLFLQRITDLTENFIGREEERETLREFCGGEKDPTRNVCLVKANPGVGKSAFIANVYHELVDGKTLEGEALKKNIRVLPYFIYGAQEQGAYFFLSTLIEALDDEFDLEKKAQGTSREELYRDLLGRMRQTHIKLKETGETLVIMIDGLDESNSIHQFIPKQIPSNIRLICSGRTGHPVVTQFWDNIDREKRTVLNLGALRFSDIKELLERVIHPLSDGFNWNWIDGIQRKSEGNPFYLKMLCEELFCKGIDAGRIDLLPDEIQDLWEKCFCRLTQDGEDQLALSIIRLLSITRSPISNTTIAEVLGEERIRCKRKTIELGELLDEDSTTSDSLPKSFYHSRLTEWVREENPRACRKLTAMIVDACSDKELSPELTTYSLKHLVSHLVDMERSHE